MEVVLWAKKRERKKAGQQARAFAGPRAASIRHYLNEGASTTPELRQMFHQEDSIPLSDELTDELIETQGIPKKDLLVMRDQGLRYCPPRNSFVSAPEIERH